MVISISHDSDLYHLRFPPPPPAVCPLRSPPRVSVHPPSPVPVPVPNACSSILSRPPLYMGNRLEMWVQLGIESPVSLNNPAYQGRDFKSALLISGKLRNQFRHRSL